MTTKKTKSEFKWNVWVWNINKDELEEYDVVPILLGEWERLKKNEKSKTKKEFSEFLRREAQYHFWAKCEYELIIHSWPKFKNDEKVDVYEQLMLNWDVFVESFWKNIQSGRNVNSEHRKQRGRTAPNRALKD